MPAKPVKSTEKPRLSAQDWADAALASLAEGGISAVAVETLAKRLGVTKGSFYWHFSSRDALIDAMLKTWEGNDVRTFERSLAIIPDPRDKMRALFRRTRQEIQSHVIFCTLFQTIDHPRVREVMHRVSQRRIDFLRGGFMELGMPPEQAAHRARLTFMSYVGFLQYYQSFKESRMSLEELDAYVDHVIGTLIP